MTQDSPLQGTLNVGKRSKEALDSLQVEQERGITVKAHTSSMLYKFNSDDTYLVILTPQTMSK